MIERLYTHRVTCDCCDRSEVFASTWKRLDRGTRDVPGYPSGWLRKVLPSGFELSDFCSPECVQRSGAT